MAGEGRTKVFLVEDEYIIREAIKRTVNWTERGYELVGEAGDGEKAYPMILSTSPDILITDIRMPFMDGLELCALVREKLPQMKVVILSGYDDFSYAQQAIRLGVTQYLLKPVSGARLLETLDVINEELREERSQVDYKAIYEKEHAERLIYERQEFYRDLIDGRMPMAKCYDRAQKLGIILGNGYFAILLLQVTQRQDKENSVDERSEKVLEAISAILSYTEQFPYMGYYEQLGGVICMLLTATDRQTLEERTEKEIRQMITLTKETDELNLFVAVGNVAERISEIPQSFKTASRRFAGRFMYDEGHIFRGNESTGDQEGQVGSADHEGFSLSGFDISRIDKPIIYHFLRSGRTDEVFDFVRDCFAGVSISNFRSQLVRQYIAMDTYLTIASYLQTIGLDNERIETVMGKFAEPVLGKETDEIIHYLEGLFHAALVERDHHAEESYGSIVAQAKQLIYRDFADSSLSLGQVAQTVGVSTNHLSRLFSQSMGETFVEFLTGVRMEKAKELLLSTDQPSSEISLQVGYADPHYFYYLFKKTQGQTPKEYRQGTGR